MSNWSISTLRRRKKTNVCSWQCAPIVADPRIWASEQFRKSLPFNAKSTTILRKPGYTKALHKRRDCSW
jgi:hypothetical protein